jgi:cyclopropane fatty-acyl-phospholipid synthase-like methyltransferase
MSEFDDWRSGLREFDSGNELILCATFATIGKPASMLDVGCGTGAMVRAARALQVDAVGIDQLVTPAYGQGFFTHDLRTPLNLQRQFGMVMTVEVAEHLEPEYTGTFMDTITRHVAPMGVLVFTAALPGQSGLNHFNCQFPEWWANRLYDRGLRQSMELTYKVALAWRLTPTQLQFLASNVMIWERLG